MSNQIQGIRPSPRDHQSHDDHPTLVIRVFVQQTDDERKTHAWADMKYIIDVYIPAPSKNS